MKKSEMVTGKHIFKRRDGIINNWDSLSAEFYNEDLIDKDKETDFDVIAVYELPKPLWERG